MPDFFAPAPEPATELGRFRILSSSAGVRVSPLQLGAMSIGDAWQEHMGSMNKADSFKLLDSYVEAGGNFIDTANGYQDGQSETWIGEWMKQRQNRDLLVLATKYTGPYMTHELGKGKTVNYCGNHKKSLHMSARDSLRKLQTDYIDVLYVHWWDHASSIREIMDSLHILVQQGKVLYLGISDTPAWIVAAANTYAIDHGKTPFTIFQGRWNILVRDIERDIVPMCRHFGMAIAPWDVLGGGKFQSKKQLLANITNPLSDTDTWAALATHEFGLCPNSSITDASAEIEEREKKGEGLRLMSGPAQTEDQVKISEALSNVAAEHGIESVTAVALAWGLSKAPNIFPIVGGRKVEHLKDNIQALSIKLTAKQIEYLQGIKPMHVGFPQDFVGDDPHLTGKSAGFIAGAAPMAWVLSSKAIGQE